MTTQEQKDLLLKDLAQRLPYEPIVEYVLKAFGGGNATMTCTLDTIHLEDLLQDSEDLVHIKPYLRPMSSMTDEEKKEFIEYAGYEIEESVNGRHYEYYLKDFCGTPDNPSVNADGVDWLNKKMFDFRGLIPKDLALSTETFNPYKD